MISQQGDKLWRECDICGTLYPLVSREFSPIFYGIPLTDSIYNRNIQSLSDVCWKSIRQHYSDEKRRWKH